MTWASEEQLAMAVSAWLRADGWETYHEVCDRGGNPRADIVATRGRLVHVVECKLRLGLEVLAQADRWRWKAHFVSVATPKPYKGTAAYGLARRVASDRGIGLITVGEVGSIWSVRGGAFYRTAEVAALRRLLTPEHKTSIPGGKGPGFHTPFKETCKRVLEEVRKAGGRAPVKATILAVEHHYASDKSVSVRSSTSPAKAW